MLTSYPPTRTDVSKTLLTGFLRVLAFTICSNFLMPQAQAQIERGDGENITGPSGFLAGPFGRPRLVLDEFGSVQQALEIYSDGGLEAYIPDITSLSWVAWHVSEYRESGTYTVMVYLYTPASQRTTRQLTTLDTRKQIASMREEIWGPPVQISLSDKTVKMARVLARLQPLVNRQMTLYNAQMAQRGVSWGDRPPSGVATFTRPPLALGSAANGRLVPPEVLAHVDPEFTEAARLSKHGGVVVVGLIVDDEGLPQSVYIVTGIENDLGLNAKAIEAVQHYRFKPATKDGKPVPFSLKVNVDFTIF